MSAHSLPSKYVAVVLLSEDTFLKKGLSGLDLSGIQLLAPPATNTIPAAKQAKTKAPAAKPIAKPTPSAKPTPISQPAKQVASGIKTRGLSHNEKNILRALTRIGNGIAKAPTLKKAVLKSLKSCFGNKASLYTWNYSIKRLLQRKLIHREGTKRGTKYFLSKNAPARSVMGAIKRERRALAHA